MDFLLQLSNDSEFYTSFQLENGAIYSISANSPIVSYNEDGYISYLFHYAGSSAEMSHKGFTNSPYFDVDFETGNDDISGKTDYIKLALLDAEGQFFHITDPIRVSSTWRGYFTGFIEVDIETYAITNDGFYEQDLSLLSLLLILLILPRMLFTVITETFIAHCFKIRPLHKVVFLNIATQILLAVIMRFPFPSYASSLIVGEIAVYAIEAAAMLLLYRQTSKKRLLLFVAVANTVTLVLGLALNALGIFRF